LRQPCIQGPRCLIRTIRRAVGGPAPHDLVFVASQTSQRVAFSLLPLDLFPGPLADIVQRPRLVAWIVHRAARAVAVTCAPRAFVVAAALVPRRALVAVAVAAPRRALVAVAARAVAARAVAARAVAVGGVAAPRRVLVVAVLVVAALGLLRRRGGSLGKRCF